MNRDKVLELAREAHDGSLRPGEGLWHDKCQQGEIYEFCHRFAALIEREVRGDAEPVAYETDQELWAADAPDINNWIRKNGRPLYRHPTPAVVRQPLTDDEINSLQLPESGTGTIRDLVRVVELAHGIGGSDE